MRFNSLFIITIILDPNLNENRYSKLLYNMYIYFIFWSPIYVRVRRRDMVFFSYILYVVLHKMQNLIFI